MAPYCKEFSALFKDVKLFKKIYLCSSNIETVTLVKKEKVFFNKFHFKLSKFTKLKKKLCRKSYDDQDSPFKIEFASSGKKL